MSVRRERVIAANWKMHKAAVDVDPYFDAFFNRLGATADDVRLLFFPPSLIIADVVSAVDGRVGVGGQNCYWEPEGAFTGEVSAPMLRATGARHVLVGHSERRHVFGETDGDCRRKVRAALDAGIDPMLCVGETLEQRDEGRHQAVVVQQLSRAVDGLSRDQYRRLRIAYEPVWAIGTGRTAEPADAQEMHAAIRRAMASIAGPEASASMPILYGGSVKPGNASGLLSEDDIDGALVGGASLEPTTFAEIASAA